MYALGGIYMTNYELTQNQKEELAKIGELYRKTIYDISLTNLPLVVKAFGDGLKEIGGEISSSIIGEIYRFHRLISSDYTPQMRKRIDELHKTLSNHLPKCVSFYIVCRQKSWESALRKILKYYFDGASISLSDVVALRIILDSNLPAERLNYIAHQTSDMCIKYFRDNMCTLMPPAKVIGDDPLKKDYIKYPKPNGYQSIHLIFMDIFNNIFEVQIRTQEMDANAELGLTEYRLKQTATKNELKHTSYKDSEYAVLLPYIFFDPKNVRNMPLFKCYTILDDNGVETLSIVDKIGLCKAKSIEERAHTF